MIKLEATPVESAPLTGSGDCRETDVESGVILRPDGQNTRGKEGVSEEETEKKERLAWDSKLQYFFMVVSYAVGLGNVWRFPYLTQMHGGGKYTKELLMLTPPRDIFFVNMANIMPT
ncbi:hypothetical protein RRG08_064771 [Elysia crispata]|uniref:Transporter n=1 Tax=Elysia crispata TaxID=231223 RepID=A0AAE0Z0P5_9GAST|nr:hypothetical protein RRG08_064771 [Elysia crispata]